MIRIFENKGMVNIEHDKFDYTNIKDLYHGYDGNGLQVEPDIKDKYKEIRDKCAEIAALIYELEDMTE